MSPSLEAMACRALSSSRFAELLATANLCVLDVRPFLQYNKGHVRDAINVPMSGLTLRRIARNGLGDFLTQEVKERMLKASTVVLYDAQTEDVNQEPPQTHTPSALKIMMDALDSRAVTVFFLCGGFSSFETAYPSLCKLAQKQPMTSLCTRINIPASAPAVSLSHHPLARLVSNDSSLSLGEPSSPDISDTHDEESPLPAQLAPHILLGSIHHASDREVLRKAGVTAVLNVSNQCSNYFSDELLYKQIPVEDSSSASLMPYFKEASEFIDAVEKANGRVLIHCVGGVSRSPTICISYFVQKGLMTVTEAYKFIKERRPVIGPNFSFMGELQMLEEQLSRTQISGQQSPV